MPKNDQAQADKQKQATTAPVVQQFAAGGSAVATPEVPYDVEKVRNGSVNPAPKPEQE
ncbi:MAG: hypothetical protein K0R85_265 [Devosia sp.]|jgi:hypothetical protein|nr:hypothetical protein [Devosia sp.]